MFGLSRIQELCIVAGVALAIGMGVVLASLPTVQVAAPVIQPSSPPVAARVPTRDKETHEQSMARLKREAERAGLYEGDRQVDELKKQLASDCKARGMGINYDTNQCFKAGELTDKEQDTLDRLSRKVLGR